MVRSFLFPSLALCLVLLDSVPVGAVETVERLLPASTKAMASVLDVQLLRQQWNQTGLGQLMHDPALQPFLGDIKGKLQTKLVESGVELGITLEDLKGIVRGSAALAAVQPDNVKQQAAVVLLARIAGQEAQAEQLIQRALNKLAERGAKRQATSMGAVEVWQIEFPIQGGVQRACYCLHAGWLIATDHRGTMHDILHRLQAPDGKSLADLAAYQACMEQCRQATPAAIQWFVEPFGYVDVMRSIVRRHGGCVGGDLAEILAEQGFDALEGLGGMIWMQDGQRDITHRTFVYAPGQGGPPAQRFRQAARMLDLPNSEQLEAPLPWSPANLSLYANLNFKAKEAFNYAKGLVDAIAKDEVFDDVLESIKKDPNGPQVDIRNELVAHLDQRITIFSDFTQPIEPTCERTLMAIRLTNPVAVARAVDRAMGADPSVKKVQLGEYTVWEIVNEPVEAELVAIEIEGEGFGFGDEDVKSNEIESPTMPNFAITVARDHLLVATRGSLIVDALTLPQDGEAELSAAADYRRVAAHLDQLQPGAKSMHCFVRPTVALQPSYELLREGRMPESQSPLGMLLNLVGNNQQGALRQQQINGQQLPEFAEVAKYLGPLGFVLRTQERGWLLSGCFLSQASN